MTIVYPIRGQFWKQDANGGLLNIAVSREDLSLEWSCLSERAVDLALERFEDNLHSVYLSGPAARNRPGGGSLVIVLKNSELDKTAFAWASLARLELSREIANKSALNINVLRWKDVYQGTDGLSPALFRLCVNAICIGGPNLAANEPPPLICESVANTPVISLRKRLKRSKQKTLTSDSRKRIKSISAEVGHAIVSAGYATTMVNEQLYTEDLDLRRDIFSLNHPELKEEIQCAYDMAALPGNDPVQVRAFINKTESWIMPIVDDWLNTHNPQRRELLPSF